MGVIAEEMESAVSKTTSTGITKETQTRETTIATLTITTVGAKID